MDPERQPAGRDASFRRSVMGNLAAGLGLVLLSAGIFGFLGLLGGADPQDLTDGAAAPAGTSDDATDGADDEPGTADGDATPSDDPDGTSTSDTAPDGGSDAAGGGADDGDTAADATNGEETDGSPDDPAGDAGDDATGDDASTSDEPPDAGEEPPDEPETGPSFERADPATISVQVLDGFGQDGGTAADEVAETLVEAGYDLIARNPALAYEVTTVLWTAGNEDAGRQVAAEIGAAEVREQPGNLSSSVAVHVVVGADRG